MQTETLQSAPIQDLHHRLEAMTTPGWRQSARPIPVHISGATNSDLFGFDKENRWPPDILLGALLMEGFKALEQDALISRWRRLRACAARDTGNADPYLGRLLGKRIQLLLARLGTVRRQAVLEPEVNDALAPLAEELLIERSDLSRLLIAIDLRRVSEKKTRQVEATEDFYAWIRGFSFVLAILIDGFGLATDEELVADVEAARKSVHPPLKMQGHLPPIAKDDTLVHR